MSEHGCMVVCQCVHLSQCLSVCRSVTRLRPSKTAERVNVLPVVETLETQGTLNWARVPIPLRRGRGVGRCCPLFRVKEMTALFSVSCGD